MTPALSPYTCIRLRLTERRSVLNSIQARIPGAFDTLAMDTRVRGYDVVGK